MTSLFEYNDYRKFISDYCQFKKLTQKGFSNRYFLRKAGIKGPSFLKEVIEGKKNLSTSGMRKFARALDLPQNEAAYFKLLASFNQAKKPAIRHGLFQTLSSFPRGAEFHTLKKDQFEYFSHWHNVAVREYIHSHRFVDDYAAMAAAISPRITVNQAQKAVEILKNTGLIENGDDGFFRVTDPLVTFDPDIENIAAHNLHKSMLGVSARAIDTVAKERRYFRTVIGSFSETAFQKVRMELDAARKRIFDIIAGDTEEKKIYAIGMQLYGLEKDGKKENG